MESLQGVDPDLEILMILDAPQLQGLAPELVPYRDKVEQLGKKVETASCSSCTRRKVQRALVGVAREVAEKIYSTPELQGVVDALMTSALQAANGEINEPAG